MRGTIGALVGKGASGDILPGRGAVPDPRATSEAVEKELERRVREESGPVKTVLDLSEFICFSQSATRGARGEFIRVSSKDVTISHGIGKNYEPGTRVELLLNRKGTILVVREAKKGGMPLRAFGPKSKAKRVACRELINTLKTLGVELPAKFYAYWDEELKAWVGRR